MSSMQMQEGQTTERCLLTTPALMTTHTVKKPEYDPKAAKEAEAGVQEANEKEGKEKAKTVNP